ncbi:MAG: hypothetical protein DSY36_03945 [Candidatus Neomarinimicrobiota bacterium]|nr:MAG: hypothetical protein DSY36_03945 [Candidatus Neomarinimicrobiota bacterium]
MVDTPVDIYHPSLSNAYIDTLDLIDFNPADTDTMLHGTSVAGILVLPADCKAAHQPVMQ